MEDFESQDITRLTERFKQMIASGKPGYFDSEEMELIINQLMYNFEFDFLEKAINHAINQFPNESYFRVQRVKQLIFELKLDDAGKELDSIEENFPPTPEFYLEKVLFMRMMGSNQDTFSLLKAALHLDPENPEVHFFIAYEYITRKEMPKALKHAIYALKADDFYEEQLFTFSYLFEEKKLYDEAFYFYKNLSEEFPLLKGAWFGLGLAKSWAGLQREAIACYELALSLDEEMSTAHFNIANAYFELHEFEKAIEHYQKTIAIDNLDFNAYSGIGDAYIELDMFETALDYYRKALNINPAHSDSIYGTISILECLGKDREIPAFVEKIFETNPHHIELLFEIVDEFNVEVKYEKLLELIEPAIRKTEHKTDLFNLLIRYCYHHDLVHEAIDIFITYQDEKGIEEMINYYLAAIHYWNFRIAEADIFLEMALMINYQNHTEFLSFNENLALFPSAIDLIDRYRP